MAPPFIAVVMMAGSPGGASGCSTGPSQAPPPGTSSPPAALSVPASTAPPAAGAPPAASSGPAAGAPVSDGGLGVSRRSREHMFLAEHRSALRIWMTPDEQGRAAAVDTEGTDRGSATKLALLAADGAARVISPLALDVRGFHEEAKTLRSLAPIVDRRTADAVAAALASIRQRTEPPETEELGRPLGFEKPLVWALGAIEQAKRSPGAPPSGAIAAMAAGAALHEGAPRAAVVDAMIELLRTMASAARAGTR